MILPDVLKFNLDIVVCGTAVGTKSAERLAFYAGAGNLFYSTLYELKFTSMQIEPVDYIKLLKFNIGLSDLAKNVYGNDISIKYEDYDVNSFKLKMIKFKPKVICFNGKQSAKIFFNLKRTNEIQYGLQTKTLNGIFLFVAPSTSARAKKYWNRDYWKMLKELTNETI